MELEFIQASASFFCSETSRSRVGNNDIGTIKRKWFIYFANGFITHCDLKQNTVALLNLVKLCHRQILDIKKVLLYCIDGKVLPLIYSSAERTNYILSIGRD